MSLHRRVVPVFDSWPIIELDAWPTINDTIDTPHIDTVSLLKQMYQGYGGSADYVVDPHFPDPRLYIDVMMKATGLARIGGAFDTFLSVRVREFVRGDVPAGIQSEIPLVGGGFNIQREPSGTLDVNLGTQLSHVRIYARTIQVSLVASALSTPAGTFFLGVYLRAA